MADLPQILFLTGPTAAGKSDVALEIAKHHNGEIVSCDAMQVYREIRIASNRPSDAELRVVPHHLTGIISVEDDFDVARFNQAARQAIDDILCRGKLPVVVGGSGMYVSVLLDGIFSSGGRSEALREELKNIAEEQGVAVLYEKLKREDPDAAAKIHPNDLRRIVRALEVFSVDKMPISQAQPKREGLWGKYGIAVYCVTREREELYRRINERVDQMFAAGLVEEIRAIKKMNISLTAGALIGIKEVCRYLDGEYDLEAAKELMKRNTRRFAKRQLTWFRKDKRLQWITWAEGDTAETIAGEIKSNL